MSSLLSIAIAILAGLLMTRLVKPFKMPDVTAYLIAGVLIGPYCLGALGIPGLGFIGQDALHTLSLLSEVALGSPEPENGHNPFTDVAEGAYYYKAVLWAVEKGITTGTSATTFGPDRACTRGQVATFLWRAQDKPQALDRNNPFKDVADNAYYYDAVLWAVEEGITQGTGKGKFSPDRDCTRGQIVTFLYRALG